MSATYLKKYSENSLFPWLGWFVASLAGLYQFVLQTSSSVMIADLGSAFSLNSFGVSLLSSSFFYTYLICQIPAGILIDYFKPRRTVFICQAILAIACVLFATSTTVTGATISRILMGFFCAPTIVAALYLIARTLPEKYFALIAGLTETMGMLGGVAGQALLARSVIHFGWRHTMLILAGMAFLMAILAWTFIRDTVRIEPTLHTEKRNILPDLAAMLLQSQAWINGLFCGFTFGIVAAFGSFWCIPFLMEAYHVSLSQAADASAMIFFGAALGAPSVGWLSDKLNARRVFMILWSLITLIIFLIVLYANLSFSLNFFWLFILGFFSGVYLLPFAVMRDMTPVHIRGTAMGYINMMCIIIGAPILQPLIGWILHAHGEISAHAYQNALLVFPYSLFIAAVLGFFVKESQ